MYFHCYRMCCPVGIRLIHLPMNPNGNHLPMNQNGIHRSIRLTGNRHGWDGNHRHVVDHRHRRRRHRRNDCYHGVPLDDLCLFRRAILSPTLRYHSECRRPSLPLCVLKIEKQRTKSVSWMMIAGLINDSSHIPERDSNSTNAKPDGTAHEIIEQTN